MGEDEQSNLRERVGHWLDAFEIIQTEAQRRGMAAQEAKELARAWVPALTLRGSRPEEQRGMGKARDPVSGPTADGIKRALQESVQEDYERRDKPQPYTYRWHILPILPNTSGGTLTFSTTTGEQTNCVRAKGD